MEVELEAGGRLRGACRPEPKLEELAVLASDLMLDDCTRGVEDGQRGSLDFLTQAGDPAANVSTSLLLT